MAAGSKGGAPMSKWNEDALVALQRDLKKKLTVTELCDILEKPAGGFMSSAEARSVTELSGDSNQIGQIIKILRGKDDHDFAIFCDMLRKSNYGVWAKELELKAKTFKNGQGSPGEGQSRVDKPADDVKVLKQTLAVVTKAEEQSRVDKLEGELKVMKSRVDKLEGEVKVLKQTLAVVTKAEEQSRVDKLEGEVKVLKQTLAVVTKAEGARMKHIDALVEQLEQDMQALTSQANQRGNPVQISENTMAKNVMDPNETPEAIRATYKRIVAVDIGTTHTKVAWSQTVTPPAESEAHLFVDGQWGGQRQVPTAVLYRPSQERHRSLEFDSFGHEAIHKYREGRQRWALFRTFKMDLHRRMDFDKYVEVSGCTREGDVVTLPAVKVFCDILVYIKDILLEYFHITHGQTYTKEDIKWVLTVPAMWRASARDVMRQAAKEAQIYQKHAPRQLAIALELESAALHVRSLQARDLILGSAVNAKRYIVIDIRHGTIDVAVHAVECHEDSGKEYVHEIEGCIGSANGATVVDKKFETFLCNLDVPGYPKVFSRIKHKPQVWTDLMARFETCKVKYEGEGEMLIEMPSSMFVQFAKETSVIFESLVQHKSPQAYINEGCTLLRVPADKCLDWYETTISSTVELIRKLNDRHHVEAIFVVGGFANCKILHQRLEKEFPALQLVIPRDPGFATVQGAVRYGPLKAITSRTSYATYGTVCSRPFRDDDDPRKKFWSERHQYYYCTDTFSVFVTRGQKVNPAAPYTKTYNPMCLDQTSVTFAIYATDATDPKFVTDPGCVKIGKLSIDIPPLPAGATAADDNQEVIVKMDFSATEIFITADDNTGQYHSELTVDFLPSCQYHGQ